MFQCRGSSSLWRWVEFRGDNSKHSKDSTDTTPTHFVASNKVFFLKKKERKKSTPLTPKL